MTTSSIKVNNFGDIISIVELRGNINGTVRDKDRDFIKGAINEHYINICTERKWHWTKFDRDFLFDVAITTGTVAVEEGSREVVFTGLTLQDIHRGRSIRFNNKNTLYRIIGINTTDNKAYLSREYVDEDDSTATFKMYQYEFPLPPDCDVIEQLYIDMPTFDGSAPDIVAKDNSEFNRLVFNTGEYNGAPKFYTRDSSINTDNLPPLDDAILDYDFLAGTPAEEVSKIRFFPIEPDTKRVIHLSYSKHIQAMVENSDIPVIPVSSRWILVHLALAEWHMRNGNLGMSDRERQVGMKMLSDLRCKHNPTDLKPQAMHCKSRYLRTSYTAYPASYIGRHVTEDA